MSHKPDPNDTPRSTPKGVKWLNINQGTIEFKDGDVEKKANGVKGTLYAMWREWDEGNATANVKPGWRLHVMLEEALIRQVGQDGWQEYGRVELRARAETFIFTFLGTLYKAERGEFLSIQIRPGNNPKVTFADVHAWRSVGGNDRWEELRSVDLSAEESRIEAAWKLMESHGSHGKPPEAEDGRETHEKNFKAKAAEQGWPAPADAEAEYVALMNKVSGQVGDELSDFLDHAWGQLFLACEAREWALTKSMKSALDRIAQAPPKETDGNDPFEDEKQPEAPAKPVAALSDDD